MEGNKEYASNARNRSERIAALKGHYFQASWHGARHTIRKALRRQDSMLRNRQDSWGWTAEGMQQIRHEVY